MATQNKTALLLLSGGPDSATLTKKAENEIGGDLYGLYFKTNHPQDNIQMEGARRVAMKSNVKIEIADISTTISLLGGKLPMIHSEASILQFGNAYLLSIAMSYSFQVGIDEVWIGLHKDDAEESKEYTRDFIDFIENMASYAYDEHPIIKTPFLEKSKTEVFNEGKDLGVDFSITWSCIRASSVHCGICGACIARAKAFNEANIEDPTEYQESPPIS